MTYPETVSTVHLSGLLGRPIVTSDGQRFGKLIDVIVVLPERGAYPRVTGLVAKVSGRDLYVEAATIATLSAEETRVTTARLDVRPFERRPREVLLRADILGHRLIDVPSAKLVRAHDVELDQRGGGWVLSRVDTSSRRRLFGLLAPRAAAGAHETRDWSEFEALIGHSTTVGVRNPLARLRRLRPAQIADLVEAADRQETDEILQAVHADVELEADVFEEMEPDRQIEVLRDRSDAEVAEVLVHMRPDDAADLIADLPQSRRLPVLGLLPAPAQIKIRNLLGFNPATAGGLMNPDFLALPADTTVAAALAGVAQAHQVPHEGLAIVYATSAGVLSGSITLAGLIQADPSRSLAEVGEANPVHVHPDADLTEVAIRMTDFNLVTIPVVDDTGVILGVVTVDDVLEVTVPQDWRKREEGAPISDRPKPDSGPAAPSAGEQT